MKIRRNNDGLAIFNKIFAAEQTLDIACQRIPPGEAREYVSNASKILGEACELLEKFVEEITK